MVRSLSIAAISVCIGVMGIVQHTYATKRVLYIDSYHEGYPWSDIITEGIKSVLDGENVILKIYRMDTKRNNSEAAKKKAALVAKEIISTFRPDVVIASDDNASKYLIVPYYKDSSIPFVFCGVNYSADDYGFPTANVTGMVEVPPMVKLVYCLKFYSRASKVGYLASDTFTERKQVSFLAREISEPVIDRYVTTFSQWKSEFNRLQDVVDILIVGNNAVIKNWDMDEAKSYVLQNTRIPTGGILPWMTSVVFLSATIVPKEQGVYAAKTALKILNGASVSSISVQTNVEADIIINMKLSKKLGLKIPNSFRKRAAKIIE